MANGRNRTRPVESKGDGSEEPMWAVVESRGKAKRALNQSRQTFTPGTPPSHANFASISGTGHHQNSTYDTLSSDSDIDDEDNTGLHASNSRNATPPKESNAGVNQMSSKVSKDPKKINKAQKKDENGSKNTKVAPGKWMSPIGNFLKGLVNSLAGDFTESLFYHTYVVLICSFLLQYIFDAFPGLDADLIIGIVFVSVVYFYSAVLTRGFETDPGYAVTKYLCGTLSLSRAMIGCVAPTVAALLVGLMARSYNLSPFPEVYPMAHQLMQNVESGVKTREGSATMQALQLLDVQTSGGMLKGLAGNYFGDVSQRCISTLLGFVDKTHFDPTRAVPTPAESLAAVSGGSLISLFTGFFMTPTLHDSSTSKSLVHSISTDSAKSLLFQCSVIDAIAAEFFLSFLVYLWISLAATLKPSNLSGIRLHTSFTIASSIVVGKKMCTNTGGPMLGIGYAALVAGYRGDRFMFVTLGLTNLVAVFAAVFVVRVGWPVSGTSNKIRHSDRGGKVGTQDGSVSPAAKEKAAYTSQSAGGKRKSK